MISVHAMGALTKIQKIHLKHRKGIANLRVSGNGVNGDFEEWGC